MPFNNGSLLSGFGGTTAAPKLKRSKVRGMKESIVVCMLLVQKPKGFRESITMWNYFFSLERIISRERRNAPIYLSFKALIGTIPGGL